jgi:UDP-2,3-diacylglucosamine hydrolase
MTMAASLFLSDLHLDPARPQQLDAFVELLSGAARQASAVYILGDLFEAWLGDDDDTPLAGHVANELSALAACGVPIAFMRGNRDFLLGHAYAARCGMRLLPDLAVVDLHGVPTLLLHGDLLCTEDTGYQAFRRQVRDPAWQAGFLAQPLAARQAYAATARAASAVHQDAVGERITDVTPDAVKAMFRLYGLQRMIHGHTHRPATHLVEVDNQTRERIVLADWYGPGEALWVADDGRVTRTSL